MKMARGLLLLCLATLFGCGGDVDSPADTITLATTTSTRDSGLLDELLPIFREQSGVDVKVIAVGSGQALEMGRRGDADVLLTHALAAEQQFLDEGFGVERVPVMYNDFVVVGPESDPAGVKSTTTAAETITAIADTKSPFVSRGDESGTHMKERTLWKSAGVEPQGDWYLESGSGMGATLRMASEKDAYTLTDRGTYLALRDGLQSVILTEGDSLLRNDYAVLLLNTKKHPHIKQQSARKFADFLTSPETQRTISQFGKQRFGQPLFFPNAEAPQS